MNKLSKSLSAILAASLIALAASGPLQAGVTASSFVEIENFVIKGSDGSVLNANTDFSSLSLTRSADEDVVLGGVQQVLNDSNSTADINLPVICEGTCPQIGEDGFPVVSGAPVANFATADQVGVGSPFTDLGANLGNGSYVGIDTGTTTGSANSNTSLEGSWIFEADQQDGISFEFNARAYMEAFASAGEQAPSKAQAGHSVVITLTNLVTGQVVLSLQPAVLNASTAVNPNNQSSDLQTCGPHACGVESTVTISSGTLPLDNASIYQLSVRVNTNADAARFEPELASLGDRVWNDLNADGDQDCTTPTGAVIGDGNDGCTEPGIPGVTVNLLSDCGTIDEMVVATTVTDAAGFYLFENLLPGSYCVEFDKPSDQALPCLVITGGVQSSPQNAGDDTLDSDASPTTGQTGNIVLNPGDNDLTTDAGFYCPAKIGDMLINDLDRDGIQDAGEPGVDNQTVTLFKCENNVPGDQVGLPIATDNGMYMFNPLPPGDYAVQFTAPDGFVFSDKGQGGDPAADCDTDANGLTDCVTLAANEYNDTVDACVYEPVLAGLGNFVWEDKNANGIQDAGEPGIPDIPVTLKTAGSDDLCGTGDEDEVTIATMLTDADGMYLFTGLDGGNYCVTFDKSQVQCNFGDAAFSPADVGTNDTVDSDANTGTGETGIIVLPDGVTDLTWDAGIYCPAKIGDFVWLDTDRDGIQDGGEPGIPGVTVKLLDCDGNVLDTTTTDADGIYMFSPLMPGDYNVMFTAPAGLVFSPANAGADPAVDSDADATGMAACTDLESNEYDPTWDAGLNEPADPGIDIEKATNGADADDPNAGDAPQVAAGDPVTWSYKVTNTGNVDLINVSVTDDQIGAITCTESTLAVGAMMTCTADGIADDLMNTAFTTVPGTCGGMPNMPLYENMGKATGESVDGTFVEDVDPSHYCNPPMECGDCVGKVTQLTLMYDGDSPALIEVVQKGKKKSQISIFSGTVDPGASFTFNGMDSRGTMGPEISIYVNGELHTTIHTSCSQPIGPGLVSGDFTVLSGYSLDGGLLCPLDDVPPPNTDCGECSSKVTELTLSYIGPLPTLDVEVKQRDGKKDVTVFSGTVIPDEHFNFSGVDKNDTLGTEIEIFVNGDSNTKIHTSCSQPIGPGLISGDFQVEMGYSKGGGLLCPLP